jgi:hypothetical protein
MNAQAWAQLQPLADAAQQSLAAVEELAARWHRAEKRAGLLPREQDMFAAGMMIGWEQAISLLTGVKLADVHAQLRAGEL